MEALEAILGRTSVGQVTEPGPTPAQLDTLLKAAVAAADHDRLRPWRFTIIEGDAKNRLGEVMAQSLLRRKPDAAAEQLDIERQKAKRAPTVLVVSAKVQKEAKISPEEQIMAATAAAENVMIAAHALGLGAFWRTGQIVYDTEVKREFGLTADDAIVGLIYLGTPKAAPKMREPASLEGLTARW
jgi:nitroreductase